MDLTELYRNVKEYGDICDHCLGRLVAKRSYGLSNDMRGRAIRIASALIENVPYCPPTEPCWICNNFFDQTAVWAKRVVAALDGIECRTFLVGSKVPPLIAEAGITAISSKTRVKTPIWGSPSIETVRSISLLSQLGLHLSVFELHSPDTDSYWRLLGTTGPDLLVDGSVKLHIFALHMVSQEFPDILDCSCTASPAGNTPDFPKRDIIDLLI